MKLENKVVLPFVIFFISVVIITAIFLNFSSITIKNYENIMNYDTRFESQQNILIYYDIIREASFQNYLKQKEERFVTKHDKYVKKSEALYNELMENIPNEDLRKNYKKNFVLFQEVVNIEKGVISGTTPQTYLSTEEYLSLKEEFDDSRDLPKEFYHYYVEDDIKENIQKAGFYSNILIGAIVLTFLLIFFEFFVVRRDVINPMKEVSKALSDIRKQKFGSKINVRGAPVVASVMKDLNKTSIELKSFSSDLKNMVKLGISQIEVSGKGEKVAINKKVQALQDKVVDLENMLKLAIISADGHKKK